ncbi:MAG: phosphocarrier protein HPr [Lentisphaerae bacterium RIFOXYC12_FULL_60_16]|nr:MAG: phosphocarrier protein HPr [Lentisphaerae bacterium RIFOXYC12_FULL_60_16]OGV84376.1 MAG: phosphocarrier protein HPr [Lentisphaerae bacterium RIFOXYB12_FULL_60_10]
MGITREFTIRNQYGIHARPAALFVKTCSRFESDVVVEKDGNRVSGKSIMGMMTLEASCSSVIVVTADGADAEQVLNELQRLIENKFDEE